MRWWLVLVIALGLGGSTLASCQTTSDACRTYCAEVAEQLDACDLIEEADFDIEDCEERTADVDAAMCAETTDDLEDADCRAVIDSFCPDSTLDCPPICFGDCCTDADCPSDRPACEFGTCESCTEETAATHCPSQSCYLNECVECTEQTAAVACAVDEGCDFNLCRKVCTGEGSCGDFRECSGGFCSEPVGTPCSDGDISACGSAGSCETLNASLSVVPGYCTLFCYDGDPLPCPAGYACVELKCRPL